MSTSKSGRGRSQGGPSLSGRGYYLGSLRRAERYTHSVWSRTGPWSAWVAVQGMLRYYGSQNPFRVPRPTRAGRTPHPFHMRMRAAHLGAQYGIWSRISARLRAVGAHLDKKGGATLHIGVEPPIDN